MFVIEIFFPYSKLIFRPNVLSKMANSRGDWECVPTYTDTYASILHDGNEAKHPIKTSWSQSKLCIFYIHKAFTV